MYEYEIVWNGVHDGQDRDLLNGPRQEKRPAPPLKSSGHVEAHTSGLEGWDTEYHAVRLALLRGPMTRSEIRRECDYTPRQVDVALQRCRRAGLLSSSPQPAHMSWLVGRPAVRYWIDPLG